MSSKIAIKAENISKQYRLGEVGTGTISHDLNRWWAKIRGKDDPFLKIGESNDRTSKGESDYVWSLRDISFEIQQGEAVGIIGRNGAGKSTLLKLLSKVTKPTTGSFKVKGRIASLLEVGTGFHPEMTGRENIYLNGAILGMRKHEIKRKFDEIVDFSGVERYIDTPVKRYSSGMYVRLAFAVAAHLESEILIVDEVLAVGDAEFQKKCLGKMGDVSKGEGRTVLFVSHNMGAVKSLCDKGILLNNGRVQEHAVIDDVIRSYNMLSVFKLENKNEWLLKDAPGNNVVKLVSYSIHNTPKNQSDILLNSKIEVFFTLWTSLENNVNVSMNIFSIDGIRIFNSFSSKITLSGGDTFFTACCVIDEHFFNNIDYSIELMIVSNNHIVCCIPDIIFFKVEEPIRTGDWLGEWQGLVRPNVKWHLHEKK